jgi:hypothetical protein
VAAVSRQRQLLLIGGLAVSLGLTVWVAVSDEQAEDAVVASAAPAAKRKITVESVEPATTLPVLARPEGNNDEKPANNLFEAHTWYVPPPASKTATVAEPLPRPTAPAVPYAYIGKLEDMPEGTLFMLSANNKVYTVRQGEVIDRVWRLEKEDASSLHFTYLPLALPKALSKAAKPVVAGPNNNLGMS